MKKLFIALSVVSLLVFGMLALSSCGHEHTPMTLNVERVPATCTTRGVVDVVVTCVECGEEISRTPSSSDKLPHTPSAWIVDIPSTCNTYGSQHKECVDCKEYLETSAAPLNEVHNPQIDEAVDPTDTTDGLTAGSHCADCGEVIVEQEIIPAFLQGVAIKSLSGAFEIEDEAYPEKLSCTVTNDTQIFSFLRDILVARGASYVLSTDIGCTSTIPSKTVKLNVGVNTFYLLVNNGRDSMLYYITITRMA
jgi:hypothetical protein